MDAALEQLHMDLNLEEIVEDILGKLVKIAEDILDNLVETVEDILDNLLEFVEDILIVDKILDNNEDE